MESSAGKTSARCGVAIIFIHTHRFRSATCLAFVEVRDGVDAAAITTLIADMLADDRRDQITVLLRQYTLSGGVDRV
jgi:hypothetical protein